MKVVWQTVGEGYAHEHYEFRDEDCEIAARVYRDGGNWCYQATVQGALFAEGSIDTPHSAKRCAEYAIEDLWYGGRE